VAGVEEEVVEVAVEATGFAVGTSANKSDTLEL